MRAPAEGMPVRHTGRTAREVHRDLGRDVILDAPATQAYRLVDGIAPGRRSTPGAPDAR